MAEAMVAMMTLDPRDAEKIARWRFLRMLLVTGLFAVVWPVVMGGRMLWFWLRDRLT